MLRPAAFALAAVLAATAPRETVITVIGLSDYHSHALPFRSEGQPDRGGIARVLAYIKKTRTEGPSLVLSGGDTLNKGVPAWSDEYRCVEWPWFAGLVDAMALGNHDLDYGPEVFEACRGSVSYPVLASNLVREDGTPYLQALGKPYAVLAVAGVRIGVFAVAGDDFGGLVAKEHLPPGTRWAPALEAARHAVESLRGIEKVDAVVFIGHEGREDDEAMARAVPGIDLVLGTHSHHKSELTTIPGTRTRYVAPYQYLAYVSETRLVFEGRRLARIEGGLVAMDSSRPEDPDVARRVADLQKALVAKHPERFKLIGALPEELSDAGIQDGPAPIGSWGTEACRRAAGVHVFFSTASSFRASLGPGAVTAEDFYQAIPYPNRIVSGEMTGRGLLEWLNLSLSRRDSDGFSQASGVRYTVRDGKAVEVRILRDPARPGSGDSPLDPAAVYRIGTTDFQAYVAAGYKELFATARNPRKTDLDVHTVLLAALSSS
jgi:5'-nucleotidase/UDP-sugar diphosphatase